MRGSRMAFLAMLIVFGADIDLAADPSGSRAGDYGGYDSRWIELCEVDAVEATIDVLQPVGC